MMTIDESILKFLNSQSFATICYTDGESPFCFNCYYAINEERGLLYFKTSSSARHTTILLQHRKVSGTVLPDKVDRIMTKGVQFTGEVLVADEEMMKEASKLYHRRMPMALAMNGVVFVVRLDIVKMTERKLSGARRVEWKRGEELSLPAV